MKAPETLLFALAASLAASVCAEEPSTPPAVAVSRPVPLEEGSPRSYVGVVEASATVEVTARIEGEILRRAFVEGGFVEKGQTLFELEDVAVRANLAAARAERDRTASQLAFAEKEAARHRACLGENGVSETDCELKEQERDALRSALAEAEAKVALAENDLAHARVASPVSGLVGEALVDEGNTVSPATGPLAHVVAFDPVHVRFALAERDYFELFDGGAPKGTVRVSVVRADGRALRDRPVSVDFAGNAVDPATGTVAVRLSLPNADRALLDGGYVRVLLAESFDEPRLAVPTGALLFEDGEKRVYALDENDRAVLRAVGDGPQTGDWQLLGEDFSPGDRIVTGGIHKVRPGMRVLPVER